MTTDLLIARIEDTAAISEKTQKPKFLGFLSHEESALAKDVLKNRAIRFDFFGGYKGAQRVILGAFPEWVTEPEYPICAITFGFRKSDTLRHKDFLGSLMALGLKREAVGDILIEEGRAVAFVLEEICEFIISQITTIGRTGVTLTKGFSEPLPKEDVLEDFSVTIASQRLDCVVSALAGVSRSQAAAIIAEGRVSVNSAIVEKATKSVTDGEVISIRGKGKFIISSLLDKTRKNRIILKYKKYVR